MYRRFALEYLGKYLDGLEIDRYEELEDYLMEAATNDDSDDMDVDDSKAKPLSLVLRANAL